MKSFTVLVRHGKIITRHGIAATDIDAAVNVATNRFGGIILAVLEN